jgi:hypothetical protein
MRRALPALVGASILAFTVEAGAASVAAPSFAALRLGVADGLVDGNFTLRQPLLFGGASHDSIRSAPDVVALGFFARPWGEAPDKGEFLLGGNYVAPAGDEQWELQAKYVAPGGIGAGAGYLADPHAGDIAFIKAIAQGKRGSLHYHFSPLLQDGPGGTAPGGYAALHGDHLFAGGGGDGEQWRILAAWSAKNDQGGFLDPSLEALFIDSSVGSIDGEKFHFVNGSLRRNSGFLSTPVRLGRALGPQGLQFANPVSFLSPSWIRPADVWEIGEILNVRLLRREQPGGEITTLAQAVFFPVQALGGDGRLRGLFAGLQHDHDRDPSSSLLFGHTGRHGRVAVNAAAFVDFDEGALSGVIGIKLFF